MTRVNQGLFSTTMEAEKRDTMEAEKRDPGNEVAATCGFKQKSGKIQDLY